MTGMIDKANKHFNAGRFAKALAGYDIALAYPGATDPVLQMNRGAALRSLGRHEEALSALDEAIEKIEPPSALAYFNRGLVWADMGDLGKSEEKHKKALQEFDHALGLDKNCLPAHRAKINALRDMRRYEDILTAAKAAMAVDSSTDFRAERIFALINLHRVDELRAECDYMEENQDKGPIARAYGLALFEIGNGLAMSSPADAVEYYTKASDKIATEQRASLCYNKAVCLTHLARNDEAIVSLNESIKLSPENEDAIMLLGDLYLQSSQFQLGADTYDKARRDGQARSAAHAYNHGVALAKLATSKDSKEALKKFQEALDLDPELSNAKLAMDTLRYSMDDDDEDDAPASAPAPAPASSPPKRRQKSKKNNKNNSSSPALSAPASAPAPAPAAAAPALPPPSGGTITVSLADILAKRNIPEGFDVTQKEVHTLTH